MTESKMTSPPKIILLPATTPAHYTLISRLENRVFYDDPFSIIAFGPERGSEANIEVRARSLARQPEGKGDAERNSLVMAVLRAEEGEQDEDRDGEGEIVGFAGWDFVTRRGKGMEAKGAGRFESNEAKGEGEEGDGDGDGWGTSANVKFCEDVFLVADEHMLRSTEGKDHAKLCTLIVSPEYQRRGIGQQILSDGLKEVDRLNLQCVLASSKEGLGLYKKVGFVEVERLKLRLWEYEGGEGFGLEDHIIMWRPPASREDQVDEVQEDGSMKEEKQK